MSFFQNTCKPTGLGGKLMVNIMNNGHSKLAKWGFSHISPTENADVLDAGCGGGANIASWLKLCPKGIITGLDYSEVSVEKAISLNLDEIKNNRCKVIQGDVSALPFENESFDIVSAFETIYFWPGLEHCFDEVYRVLKQNGDFMIVVECDGTNKSNEKWTKKIDGMTIYTEEEITILLKKVGFNEIKADHNDNHWMCIVAKKV